MTKLSARIRNAVKAKDKEALTNLFFEAAAILSPVGIDPYKGGNEGRAQTLEEMGY